ncbi:MAG: hypothetical protein AB8G95_05830 [Anaerolineae bacterium]
MRRNTPANAPRLSPKHNFLFLSDLHLAEGTDPQTGKLDRLEDFFYDDAFADLIVYHVGLAEGGTISSAFQKPWKLYINGDFFEFLQVVSIPDEDNSLIQNGKLVLTPRKKTYGLGTSAEETVWKLMRIAAGHPTFFQALGWFLAHPENELVIMRGNHDIELVWPAVQEAVRSTISASYFAWYRDMIDGRIPESPLPFKDSLPAVIPEDFADRISFPEWFDYEKGLFYVEHGNQYDPVNAFSSVDRPFLTDEPNLIELPAGSFFVRYLFNMVEQVHPFADNIQPLSSYIHYAINLQPAETFSILLQQPLVSIKALLNLIGKSGKMRPEIEADTETVEFCPLPNDYVHSIEQIRQKSARISRKRNSKYIRRVTAGIILRVIFLIALLFAFRGFIRGPLPIMNMIGPLVVAFLAYASRLKLIRHLNKAKSGVGLDEVADAINYVLNSDPNSEDNKSVQFLIFGHDHDPKFEELSQHQNGRSYRQWYVNTGSWLPSFNETEKVFNEPVRLSFLRIVPDRNGFDNALPELLAWHDAEKKPYRLKLTE